MIGEINLVFIFLPVVEEDVKTENDCLNFYNLI